MEKSSMGQTGKAIRRRVKSSTTLNRKYVKRPRRCSANKNTSDVTVRVKNTQSPKITRFKTDIINVAIKKDVTSDVAPAKPHPTQIRVNQRLRERQLDSIQKQSPKLTAQEIKDRAIKKALLAAEKQTQTKNLAQTVSQEDKKVKKRMKFGLGRIVLALSCATAAIFAIVYFVNLNMPDVQFRAAASQLNATYPNYLPYNYSPTGIASENNVITLSFENHNNKDNFQIVEEKSSWDSNSLLNNYVKNEYGEDYTIVREQGLTIYIGNNKASWVNGGIVYKLEVKKGSLSKKQISSIAVSF